MTIAYRGAAVSGRKAPAKRPSELNAAAKARRL